MLRCRKFVRQQCGRRTIHFTFPPRLSSLTTSSSSCTHEGRRGESSSCWRRRPASMWGAYFLTNILSPRPPRRGERAGTSAMSFGYLAKLTATESGEKNGLYHVSDSCGERLSVFTHEQNFIHLTESCSLSRWNLSKCRVKVITYVIERGNTVQTAWREKRGRGEEEGGGGDDSCA